MTKQKIAILGGGMAALATAFELTQREDLQDRFEITIYQMGWRLGGKGASGRDDEGRVVEHGLHIWFGCYENAFSMLRTAYQEWKPQEHQAIFSCEGALKPQRDSAIGDGDCPEIICLNWPPAPGDPGDGNADLSPLRSFSQMLCVVQRFYDQLIHSASDIPSDLDLDDRTIALLRSAGVEFEKYVKRNPLPLVSGTEVMFQVEARQCSALASEWAQRLATIATGQSETQLRAFVSFLRRFAKVALSPTFIHDQVGRFIAQLIDVGTATIKGIVMDMMLGELTVRDLDRMDFREWLLVCGAARDSTYGSPIVQALYDSMLQYCDGDRRRPSYGAGTAAQAVVRLYGTYRDSFAFEMQSGMGEVVVVPIYRVLKQRGVKFEFFMKLKRLELDPQKSSIARIIFDRQVNVGSGEYNPTIAPKACNGNLECWPETPLWDQICFGRQLAEKGIDLESYWCGHSVGEETFLQGDKFHTVVLAIALGAFKQLNAAPGPCAELIEANDRFRAMTETACLTPSISVQTWCTVTTTDLGWPPTESRPPCSAEKTVISTGPDPLDIWADMSQVLKYERRHLCTGGPTSLQYLCGVLETDLFRAPPDHRHVPAEARKLARGKAIEWLEDKSRYIWPGASSNGQFNWNALFDASPSPASGPDRIDSQVYRANVDPSSCCVVSAAGSTQWRLAADASGFDNLYLAGAWIDTGFNTECIEAAVMSGMQAARAVSGASFAIPGENFLRFGDDFSALFSLAAEGVTLLLEAVVDAAYDDGDAVDAGLLPGRSSDRRPRIR